MKIMGKSICLTKLFMLALAMTLCSTLLAQPNYSPDIQKEKLGRGVICLRSNDSIIVSWRLLKEDNEETAFNVYQNGKKQNKKPLKNTTFFKTLTKNAEGTFEVKTLDKGKETNRENGKFVMAKNATDYISIPLRKPENGVDPDGRPYRYSANDASVGDVDGDGEYEVILKWDPSNSHDNSQEGHTGNVYVDCYRIPKTPAEAENSFMWRIDLGKNIRAGAHYTQFIVFDLDNDGRSEVVMKTADGTIDGVGNVIGDANANWVFSGTVTKTIAGKQEPITSKVVGRILDGPEYLTVFDGQTGKALATTDYLPPRGNVGDWGDTYGNRCDRFLAAAAYLDGIHPSVVMCRGYYTRTYLTAYDWDGKELKCRWMFDSEKFDGYSGQGNHNLRVADVDGDGCDEITYGSMAVDHDGTGLYTTRMGHGDALHLMAFYPDSTSLQLWDVHENKRDGSDLRDAKTGRIIFQIKSGMDVGRGMAADIDPTIKGLEMWSASQSGFYDVTGKQYAEGISIPQNSAVWWDGDMSRELLDMTSVSKWNWKTQKVETIKDFKAEGCAFNNGTKQNPCLSADILGDWREEVIVRNNESTELRVYSTTIPTDKRFVTFMDDIPYRISVATENVGYNQPPEPSFYFGNK